MAAIPPKFQLTPVERAASVHCHGIAATYAARDRMTRDEAHAVISADLIRVTPDRRALVLSTAAASYIRNGADPDRRSRWRLDAGDLLVAAGADRGLAMEIWRIREADPVRDPLPSPVR